jgi:hypothetical protein
MLTVSVSILRQDLEIFLPTRALSVSLCRALKKEMPLKSNTGKINQPGKILRPGLSGAKAKTVTIQLFTK